MEPAPEGLNSDGGIRVGVLDIINVAVRRMIQIVGQVGSRLCA